MGYLVLGLFAVCVALACYRRQTYAHRELIVVDDGDTDPVDERQVAAAGGRLVTVEPGTPLGTKLNRGIEVATGRLCQKWDDDDWYAPTFLQTMVAAVQSSWSVVCRPTLAFLMPFLYFDVARWEVRRSVERNMPGATLMFSRDTWEERPFRGLPGDEDVWFFMDQARLGTAVVPVHAPETYLAVRHGGLADRGHTWRQQADGRALETYLLERDLYQNGPEALLPDWALQFYRGLRSEMLDRLAAGSACG